MNKDFARERAQQRQQRPPDVPAAHDAHRTPAEQDGVLVVAFAVESLGPGANGRVRLVDPPGARQGHAQSHLGDGLGEYRARPENVDPPPVAFHVVDVRHEIAFDVEYRLELRHLVQALAGKIRLADQRDRLRKMALQILGRRRRPVVPDHLAQSLQPLLRALVEYLRDRAGEGIKYDERTACGFHKMRLSRRNRIFSCGTSSHPVPRTQLKIKLTC